MGLHTNNQERALVEKELPDGGSDLSDLDVVPVPPRVSLLTLLRQRNFRLLWIGEFISLLGDQFYLIALPWLVLSITGNALATGLVLMLAAIPRAVLMLWGGALTDQLSPKDLMLRTNLIRMVIVGSLTALVLTDTVETWMLYVFALAFGTVDAFFYPASVAIVPQLLQKHELKLGNSMLQGAYQFTLFIGPALAGTLIALFSDAPIQAISEHGDFSEMSGKPVDLQGIGIALGMDTLTFLGSAISLVMMKVPGLKKDPKEKRQKTWDSIRESLMLVWKDKALRGSFALVAAVNLFLIGPVMVGIPVLAKTRFVEGAQAFGSLLSSYGGGNLIGILLAGFLPKPPVKLYGPILGVNVSIMGVFLALLGVCYSLPVAIVGGILMGIANGYVIIMFLTWLQTRTAEAMQGRMMALMMFASAGLAPVSMAVTGAFVELHLTTTFIVSGSLLFLVPWFMLGMPEVRNMGYDME